jgi:hypothetical protein
MLKHVRYPVYLVVAHGQAPEQGLAAYPMTRAQEKAFEDCEGVPWPEEVFDE